MIRLLSCVFLLLPMLVLTQNAENVKVIETVENSTRFLNDLLNRFEATGVKTAGKFFMSKTTSCRLFGLYCEGQLVSGNDTEFDQILVNRTLRNETSVTVVVNDQQNEGPEEAVAPGRAKRSECMTGIFGSDCHNSKLDPERKAKRLSEIVTQS